MKLLVALVATLALATPCFAFEFETPVLLTSEGKAIAVESPGYACPCLADVDGDGIKDLLVGQFRGGKISVFRGKENGSIDFAAHAWLEADGVAIEVPGVW